jgi:hypothetical protein
MRAEISGSAANRWGSLTFMGSRIKLDPWDDHVTLKKSKPEAVLSAREKMPFEVTPMIPNLVRTMQPLKEVAENAAKTQ